MVALHNKHVCWYMYPSVAFVPPTLDIHCGIFTSGCSDQSAGFVQQSPKIDFSFYVVVVNIVTL